jgi:transcriptional/translational regulatory protein YebC/TACO1
MIEVLTDNKNRTVGEIRHILTKWAGNLGASNSVARLFHKRSVISIAKGKATEETLMEPVLEAGADDLRDDGEAWEIVSAPENHTAVVEAVRKLGIEPDNAEVAMVPNDYIKLEGKQAQQMLKLMDALEEHDDTKNVWSNFDVDEKEIEASLA